MALTIAGSFLRLIKKEAPASKKPSAAASSYVAIASAPPPEPTRTPNAAPAAKRTAAPAPRRFAHLKSAPMVAVAAPAAPAPKALTASSLAAEIIESGRRARIKIGDPIEALRPAEITPAPDAKATAESKALVARIVAAAGRGVRL